MRKIIEAASLLEDKFEKILEVYVFLKEENQFLHQRVVGLENQLTEKTEQLNEKESSYQLLKIAKTIEGSNESTRETKLKINALVREIDQCITHLSQ